MIKAVFFDWFNTVALYHPPREELHAAVCHEHGIEVKPEQLTRGILLADQAFFEENARSPIAKRSPQEQAEFFTQYEMRLLKDAGIEVVPDVASRIMNKTLALTRNSTFVLFEDVLPTVEALKQRGLAIGLISNIERDILPLCQTLGLTPYLNFIITPREAGADKPHPAIFLAALQQARVRADEAIHVGDQYSSDIVGARGAGIKPLLLDRYNLYTEIRDCPRIGSLTEITKHL